MDNKFVYLEQQIENLNKRISEIEIIIDLIKKNIVSSEDKELQSESICSESFYNLGKHLSELENRN
tara:strand:+ start:92 stop:289 length:198 start_codon:yes stop_codon:yes gene_type:complete